MDPKVDVRKQKNNKKLTMIYAGLSEADNPAWFACDKLKQVFAELGLIVDFKKLSLDDTDSIMDSIVTSAGVVIATTVEWYGIGYQLQKFLDESYIRKKTGAFDNIPLFSIVFSRDGYEQEAAYYLSNAWQLLGGIVGIRITAVFSDVVSLASDAEAIQVIEKKAEEFYRYGLNQDYRLPQSLMTNNYKKAKEENPSLELKEISTLTEEEKIQQQKEQQNIQNLSNKLKAKFEEKTKIGKQSLVEIFMDKYQGQSDKEYKLQILVSDKPTANMVILIKKTGVYAVGGMDEEVSTSISGKEQVLRQILAGKISFQKGFMTGQITAKGELTVLYKLDDFYKGKKVRI